MKARSTLLSLIFLCAATTAFAQTSTVPVLMSYQGRVTDAAGVLIGNTGPINRTVTFRFYTASSAGTAIYAESQTVTISSGEFSVLIGNGTGVTGSPGPSSPATSPYKTVSDIINANASAALYLGVTVDDGNSSTVDAEIAPRQQVVSAAYAMRSRIAEGVTAGAITSAMLGSSAVNVDQIAASAITSTKIADLTITSSDLANNTITAGKIDTGSIGLWAPSGANVYRPGNVGIGDNNPGVALSFGNVLGDKIALYGSTNSVKYGFGIQNAQLQIYTDGNGADITLGYGSSANMTENMRVKGNGNVGIGVKDPANKLHVNGGITSQSIRVDAAGGYTFNSPGDTDGGMFSPADGTLTFLTNGTERMRLNASGNVGIGTGSPNAVLTVGAPLGGNQLSSTFNTNSGSLGTTAGAELKLASFGYTSANSSSLSISAYRATAGSGWETAPVLLGVNVDSSVRAMGSYIALANGGIGIGTPTPRAQLDVRGTTALAFNREYLVNTDSASDKKNEYYNGNTTTIITDGGVVSTQFATYSDKRIKNVSHISDAASDLDTLRKIEITDYQYKDPLKYGGGPQKKVIAQQVEEVYPAAVTKGRGVLPDIYKKATIKDGWIALATDLAVGDRVTLINDQGEVAYEVAETRAGAFRVKGEVFGPQVFVYGREVDDLRTVDYDALSMLNVSATQQIKKEKDEEIKVLQDQNTALEARLRVLEKLISVSAGK